MLVSNTTIGNQSENKLTYYIVVSRVYTPQGAHYEFIHMNSLAVEARARINSKRGGDVQTRNHAGASRSDSEARFGQLMIS